MRQHIVRNASQFSKEKLEQLGKGLNDGFYGFHYALPQQFEKTKNRFVAYITKAPLEKPMSSSLSNMPAQFNQPYGFTCYTIQNDLLQIGREFLTQYQDLLISMAVITAPNSESVTHMGIFKNPFLFISSNSKGYPNLSILLHSYAAYIFASEFKKTHQINQPTQFMRKILSGALPESVIKDEEVGVSGENHCPVREGNVTVIQLPALATIFQCFLEHEESSQLTVMKTLVSNTT